MPTPPSFPGARVSKLFSSWRSSISPPAERPAESECHKSLSQTAGVGRARGRPGATAQGIKLYCGLKHSGNNGYLAALLQ